MGTRVRGRPQRGMEGLESKAMSDLITHLRSFNRKERFILLRESLGASTFSLHNNFRERLGNLLG